MSILAQHGWGKSGRIERGLIEGSIGGVIISPRDERPQNLAPYLSKLRFTFPDSVRLVDPQFHIGTVSSANLGMLERYAHFKDGLTTGSFSPAAIRNFVDGTLIWQDALDVSGIISPTVMVDDLTSRWAQIALNLAQEAVEQYAGNNMLLIGLVVGESALRQRAQVDELLDSLTQLDVGGFYLVVRRDSEMYRQHYDSEVLSSLMHVCYSLAALNGYQVFVGYTDMATLLLHSVGVTGTGSGWSQGLRQFTLRRFRKNTFGNQPRPRYSSLPLLNSIYVTDLGALYNAGSMDAVLSGTRYDDRFDDDDTPENVDWPQNEAALHHWHVLDRIAESVVGDTIVERLESARHSIIEAQSVYAVIGDFVRLTTETGPTHLEDWLQALNTFRP